MPRAVWNVNKGFVEHPLLKKKLEPRKYQLRIARNALSQNTLAILPTGLGKTVIAVLVLAEVLNRTSSTALFLAPTKPLVLQHVSFLRDCLKLPRSRIFALTGSERPLKRSSLWTHARVVVATPQTVQKDLLAGRYTLGDIGLVVFDEAHRTVGKYAYVGIAEHLMRVAPLARILGLTASLRPDQERIDAVRSNLAIERIEIRTDSDPDVNPYIQGIDIEWVKVKPPRWMSQISRLLTEAYFDWLNQLRKKGFLRDRKNVNVTIKDLNSVAAEIRGKMGAVKSRGGPAFWLYHASRYHQLAMKGNHAIETIETQGRAQFLAYVEPMFRKGRTRHDASFVKDDRVKRAVEIAKSIKRSVHPKMSKLKSILRDETNRDPKTRIIVFSQTRDTSNLVLEMLKRARVSAKLFVGQGTRKGRKGMTQRTQAQTREAFERGDFNVLVATAIAE